MKSCGKETVVLFKLHTEIVQEKLKVENLEHSLDVGRVTLEKKRKVDHYDMYFNL